MLALLLRDQDVIAVRGVGGSGHSPVAMWAATAASTSFTCATRARSSMRSRRAQSRQATGEDARYCNALESLGVSPACRTAAQIFARLFSDYDVIALRGVGGSAARWWRSARMPRRRPLLKPPSGRRFLVPLRRAQSSQAIRAPKYVHSTLAFIVEILGSARQVP